MFLYSVKVPRVLSLMLPEYWGKEDTDISNINRNIQTVQNVMYTSRCYHKARIHCSANNTSKRVPSTLIKPIEEIVISMLYHVRCSTVIEPVNKKQLFKNEAKMSEEKKLTIKTDAF